MPIYQLAQLDDIVDMKPQQFLDVVEHQAKQGVDIDDPLRLLRASAADGKRVTGIVSRAVRCGQVDGCPRKTFYTHFDELCDIMHEYDVTWSLGDGLAARSPTPATGNLPN